MKIQEWQKYVCLAAMSGFVLGICGANLWMKEYVLDIGIFNQYFLEEYSRTEIIYKDYLWYLLKCRAVPVILLFAAAGTRYRRWAVIAISLWLGFSVGLVTCAAITKMGIRGMILILISTLPQGVFYVMAGIVLCRYMLEYPLVRWNLAKSIKLAIFVLAGIVTECYVNPVIIKIFLKTL